MQSTLSQGVSQSLDLFDADLRVTNSVARKAAERLTLDDIITGKMVQPSLPVIDSELATHL